MGCKLTCRPRSRAKAKLAPGQAPAGVDSGLLTWAELLIWSAGSRRIREVTPSKVSPAGSATLPHRQVLPEETQEGSRGLCRRVQEGQEGQQSSLG